VDEFAQSSKVSSESPSPGFAPESAPLRQQLWFLAPIPCRFGQSLAGPAKTQHKRLTPVNGIGVPSMAIWIAPSAEGMEFKIALHPFPDLYQFQWNLLPIHVKSVWLPRLMIKVRLESFS
jgi:hypothetical protein